MTAPQTMRPADWGLLVLLALLWGGSFLFIAVAVRDLPVFTVVAARVALAAVLLVLALHLLGHRLPDPRTPEGRRAWTDLAVMGLVANAFPFSLIAWGQSHIPSGLAAMLNTVTPLFSVLLLAAAGVERVGRLRAVGLALGMAGVAVLMGPKALAGPTAGLVGALAVVTGSAFYAVAGLWGRRFKDRPPVVTSAGALLAASIPMVPLALVLDRPWTLSPGLPAVAAVLVLATVSTAIAYLLFYRIMSRAGPTNAALVTFLVPVAAVSLGALVLGERLPWTAFAGMAVVFVGLAAIDGRPVRWLHAKLTGATRRTVLPAAE